MSEPSALFTALDQTAFEESPQSFLDLIMSLQNFFDGLIVLMVESIVPEKLIVDSS